MWSEVSAAAAAALMRAFPAEPSEDARDLWEIFRHRSYLEASSAKQAEMQLEVSRHRYAEEMRRCHLDPFLRVVPAENLEGSVFLDKGCFTGGRLVYWVEKYGIGEAHGIDINPVFAEAGARFAAERGCSVRFHTGVGEALPFPPSMFDFVSSIDVLEHVQDPARVLAECFRVLKPGGRLLIEFPQYLQPYEAHLGLYTRLNALHWIFSGRTLARAAYDVGSERGPGARWYALESPHLAPWERSPTLNGLSASGFWALVERHPWQVEYVDRTPVRMARAKDRRPVFNLVRRGVLAAARLPGFQELLLTRVRAVLRTPEP